MSKLITALGLSAGLALGGYGFYVGELDGSKPLSAGQGALLRGEYLDAIQHFDQVFDELRRSAKVPVFAKGLTIEKRMHSYEASLGLAEVYLRLDDTEQARAHLEDARGISYDPKLALLEADIAIAEADFEAATAALTELGQWSGKAPSLVRVQLARARHHRQQGNCHAALEDFERVFDATDGAMAPARVALRGELAWLLATAPDAECRDGERALALLAPAVAYAEPLYSDEALAELYGQQAAAYAETGDFEAARTLGRKAVALAPPHTQIHAALQPQLAAYTGDKPWRE